MDGNAITLRPLDVSDIDDFMVWVSDERVSHFCSFEAYTDKEEGLKYINNKASTHPWLRAICINDRAIGVVTVTPNSGRGRDRTAELGYLLASAYWGRGIATQAVKMVVSGIFEDWPRLERLEALVDVENGGSLRVLEKAGLTREGVLRKFEFRKGRCVDFVMFSFLSTDDLITS